MRPAAVRVPRCPREDLPLRNSHSRNEGRRDPCGEPRAFLRFIEDMEAAAVEDELKRILGRRAGEKVQSSEAAIEIALGHLRGSSFDGERGDIDAKHVEPALGQPKGVGPGSRADLESPGGLNATRSDQLDQQRFGFPGVPGKISRGVTLIPATMRHHHKSNAQSMPAATHGPLSPHYSWRSRHRAWTGDQLAATDRQRSTGPDASISVHPHIEVQ